MFVTNAAYRFLESKKCTEVLIQEMEHRSKEELTLRSSYGKFPIGSIGLNITSLNLHFSHQSFQHRMLGRKKAEPKTPHFFSLNQDIVARS